MITRLTSKSIQYLMLMILISINFGCSMSEAGSNLVIRGNIKNKGAKYGVFAYGLEIDSLRNDEQKTPNINGSFETEIWFKSGGNTEIFGFKIFERKIDLPAFTFVLQDSAGKCHRKIYDPTKICNSNICDIGNISIASMTDK